MKFSVKKNPSTCEELSDFIGFTVNRWTKYPDGSMELDLAVDSLTPGEKVILINRLEQAGTHLVES